MNAQPILDHAKIPIPVRTVVERLQQGGHAAYLVGGCVRDLVRGADPKDYDVATSARPDEVKRLFTKVIPTGIEHGTVTVVLEWTHVEVTTFRTEGDYVDGRRPTTVEFRTDVRDDLSRRDFTINAMAYDPSTAALVDPFGGQADLKARVIRCVGSALDRFSEDGLRALRAVRFATVLEFGLDESTREAIPRTLQVFRKVSRERIRIELAKLLLARAAATGVRLLQQTGLLTEFLPEADTGDLPRRAKAVQDVPARLELRLAVLLSPVAAEVARAALRRLTFPNKTIDRVGQLLSFPMPAEALTVPEVELRKWLAQLGAAAADDGVELSSSFSHDDVDAVRRRVAAILARRPPLSARDLALDGGEVMRVLGVPPSPIVGEATRFLLERVLEDPDLNSPAALADQLRKWAQSRGI